MQAFTRTALAAALALGVAAPATAQFSNMYFFGDSLTDAGSYKPVLPPGTGLFTTNPGPDLGAGRSRRPSASPRRPSNQGGTDYAQGGARVTQLPGYLGHRADRRRDAGVRHRSQQLHRQGPLDGNALYTVEGGDNDMFTQFDACCSGPDHRCAGAGRTSRLAATQLAQQVGAPARPAAPTTSWSATFPTSGKTPAFAGDPRQVAAFTRCRRPVQHARSTRPSTSSAIQVDPRQRRRRCSNEIARESGGYGFTNATGSPAARRRRSCARRPTSSRRTRASTYLFADGVHPTTAAPRDPRAVRRRRSSSPRSRWRRSPRRRSPSSRRTGARSTAGCCRRSTRRPTRASSRPGPRTTIRARTSTAVSDQRRREPQHHLVGGDIKLSTAPASPA